MTGSFIEKIYFLTIHSLTSLVLQNPDLSFLKTLDPDWLASDEAIWSGYTLFWLKMHAYNSL